ncbi:MAG: hypothetical protein JWM27_1782 [Gemmatimonadetes bacterium]|nr:hypothetical protein [Gemmatimonadota bacterium]
MHLDPILLPRYDNDDPPFGREPFHRMRAELTERFGGVTAYLRAASGAWKERGGDVEPGQIAIVEVMDDALDRAGWSACRTDLERHFRQDQLVVRALPAERR